MGTTALCSLASVLGADRHFLTHLAKTFVLRDNTDSFIFGFMVLTTVPRESFVGEMVEILANVNDGI